MDDSHHERLHERLVELEVRIAFQDQLTRGLDDFVRVLSARLEKAEREVAELKQSARSPSLVVGPADGPPPHYSAAPHGA